MFVISSQFLSEVVCAFQVVFSRNVMVELIPIVLQNVLPASPSISVVGRHEGCDTL